MATGVRAYLLIDGYNHPEWCGEGDSYSEAINNIRLCDKAGNSKRLIELIDEQPHNKFEVMAFELGTPKYRLFGQAEIIEVASY